MTLGNFRIIALCILAACPSLIVRAQKSSKDILLHNVKLIPLPDSPDLISATYVVNELPEIIATANTSAGADVRYNAIVTSHLGKGKIILLGSSAYVKKSLLSNANVRQLFTNILTWGSNGKNNGGIGIWGQTDSTFQQFFSQTKNKLYALENGVINKKVHFLFLAEDVKDSIAQKAIETFIRNGGTVVFVSPLADIFNKLAQENSDEFYHLELNNLFVKAGLFHVYNPVVSGAGNNSLLTDSIPYYLHIDSILAKLQNQGFNWLTNKDDAKVKIAEAAIKLAVLYNGLNSPINDKIIKIFQVNEDSIIIPTKDNPVKEKEYQRYMAYQLQHVFIQKKLKDHPNLSYKAPAGFDFPGTINDDAARIDEDKIIAVHVGTQGLWNPPTGYSRPHTTGYYVPAGTEVIVSISSADTGRRLQAQIGLHDDDLSHMNSFTREGFDLTTKFDLNKPSTTIYSPYGGLLMINVADTSTLKSVAFHVKGVVKSPYYKLGITPQEEWDKTIANIAAPWAELATDKIVLTVPSYRIKNLHHPDSVLRFWDEVMDADADLAVISRDRFYPERIIVDREVAWGYMFCESYKIVTPDDETCEWMLNESYMRDKGSWGHFHEIGHRHQFWGIDFDALGEVTENLYSMYVYDKVLHKGIYNHEAIPSKQAVIDRIKKYLADKPDYDKWSNDAFLALHMYIELIEGFGWEPIIAVNKVYRALPKDMYPKSDADRRDYWFQEICKATQKDLTKFFDIWKVPVSEKVKQEAATYPQWLPPELQ